MKPIEDHLRKGLAVLFVGFNPSLKSGEVGHHYANPNNRFWRILFQAGLTSRLYRPEEDQDLLEIGFGFTNIVSRPTKEAAEITREEYAQGRLELRRKIEQFRPKLVCFVGKGVYEEYSKRKSVRWGAQAEPIVEGVIDFVAPSSSGLVRIPMPDMVEIYRQLNGIIK
ncbi:G/U mismatch-specific DNA glycosylase [Brevibacillus ginsengisoli]|uniref:G/U mismatch-specific DNA glycosylase n=1 Tax=Brevibacillus ginsengisoli TaxID=363854 RepID=UPI003CFB56A7